ncbi:Peroxisomal membrane protein PEX13 [Cladobotryum mycophilum]|uniref:Peroxisomal membrane protein PEX13 n=1 Tax=Cladobotryum mycophilum TaxID=491253 RepID=A0ABR0SLZ5_9HYPO
MASPPKPWERAAVGTSPVSSLPTPASATTAAIPSTATTATEAPPVPDRPSSLNPALNPNSAAYNRAGAMGTMGTMGTMGASPYGSYGSSYSSPYSSPYSRFGGGYGGMGGMYGGYGGMGGMGGMYGGGMYGGGGMAMAGGDPNSLTQRFGNSTAATFQMLEGMVTAFGGFAQMLESTYMATHSSFFAMISVAEQFGNLRDTMGHILGVFTLVRWLRTLIAKIRGRPPPADATALTPAAFARFEGRSIGADGTPQKASRKPLLFFLLAAFGLPYLMSKMIRGLAASAEEEEKRLQQQQALAEQPVDPSKLEFCRLLFDFAPQQQGAMELEAKKGDLVAVLSKNDPTGNPSEWWHCRSRDGRQGYLPSTYLEVLKRPSPEPKKIKAISDNSRTNSLTSSVMSEEGRKEYATAEGMQRSQFYS